MFDIDFEDRAALALLDDITDRLNRPEQLLDILVDRLHEYEQDVFATSGHGEWPALSAKTTELKGSSRILVDSGDLFDQLTSSSDISGDEADITATTAYAGYLKHGTGRMPRRDPAPEPPAHVTADVARTALDYVVDGHR